MPLCQWVYKMGRTPLPGNSIKLKTTVILSDRRESKNPFLKGYYRFLVAAFLGMTC